MKAVPALVVVGVALAVAGCSGDGDDEQATPGRQPPKLVERTVVEGGSPRQRAVLRRAARGMGKTTFTRITIRPAAPGEADAGSAVSITFMPARGESVRRQWDEWIVAGAFSRRLHAAGIRGEVVGSDRDGRFTARPRVPGQPDPRPLPRGREAALVKGIRRAAKRSGADVVRLDVHRPYGAAVALSLATSDPARFLQKNLRPLIQRLDVLRRSLEGIYLAVLDERRRLALEWGSWTRNPAGSYWVRPDLAECSPIKQSEPPGAEPPPPCPA